MTESGRDDTMSLQLIPANPSSIRRICPRPSRRSPTAHLWMAHRQLGRGRHREPLPSTVARPPSA